MIGVEQALIATGAAALGGIVTMLGAVSMPEGVIDPWAVPVGSAGLSGIVFYVIYLWEKGTRRSEERWDKHQAELMELLTKAVGKKGGSGDG